jgi:hypothetical protein
MHPIRRLENFSVGKKKQKVKKKMTKKRKKILAIEREKSKIPSTRQYMWVTLILFHFFYSLTHGQI